MFTVLIKLWSQQFIFNQDFYNKLHNQQFWKNQKFLGNVWTYYHSTLWLFSNACYVNKITYKQFTITEFFFLGPHLQHMEVPRLGFESELKLPAYTTIIAMWDPSHIWDLCCSLQQLWILNPLNEARDWTCILMDISWIFF